MMRGRRTAPPDLPAGLYFAKAKGRAYVYAWRGGPRLFSPVGSAAFLAEYQAAKAAARALPGTDVIAGLILEFEASREFKSLAPATRADHRRAFEEIRKSFAETPVIAFDAPRMRGDLRRWRDKFPEPRRADKLLGSFSRLLTFARDEGLIAHNIAREMRPRYRRDPDPAPVSEADIKKTLAAATTPGEIARAIRVIALSGLSRADAAALAWTNVKPDRIDMRRKKSKIRLTPELTPALKAAIGERAKGATAVTVLTDARGKPWRADALGKAISAAFKSAGVDATAHDLRASCACRLMREGKSDEAVADALGWSPKTVRQIRRHYVTQEAIFDGRIARKGAAASADDPDAS